MGPGDEHLGPLGGPADLHHVDLQAVALAVGLAPDLLARGQKGLSCLVAGADAEIHCAGAGVHAGDHTGEKLVLLGGELIVYHATLGLAHTLNDDLPGGLGGDAAEVPGLDLNADNVAQLGVGQLQPGLVQAHLRELVVDGLHHVLFDEHADLAPLLVGVHGDVVPSALVVPLVGGDQGLGDFFHHVALGDALFLLDHVNGGKELLAVQLVGLLGFCISLGHVTYLLTSSRRGAFTASVRRARCRIGPLSCRARPLKSGRKAAPGPRLSSQMWSPSRRARRSHSRRRTP